MIKYTYSIPSFSRFSLTTLAGQIRNRRGPHVQLNVKQGEETKLIVMTGSELTPAELGLLESILADFKESLHQEAYAQKYAALPQETGEKIIARELS